MICSIEIGEDTIVFYDEETKQGYISHLCPEQGEEPDKYRINSDDLAHTCQFCGKYFPSLINLLMSKGLSDFKHGKNDPLRTLDHLITVMKKNHDEDV